MDKGLNRMAGLGMKGRLSQCAAIFRIGLSVFLCLNTGCVERSPGAGDSVCSKYRVASLSIVTPYRA